MERGIMALITCPECNKKISDTTDSCPHCGYKLTPAKVAEIKKAEQQVNAVAGCIAIILIISAVLYMRGCFSSDSKEQQHSEQAKVEEQQVRQPEQVQAEKSGETATGRTARKAQRSIEHNLAIIHEGWEVPTNHTTVFRFRYLLKELKSRCIQSEQEIGDMTVSTREYIRRERGIKMNLLSMMEEMNETIKVGYPNGKADYAQLLAFQGVFWMQDSENRARQ
jgi:hypothetical protein